MRGIERAARAEAGPMPETWRSCGDWMAPANRISSLDALRV